MTTPQPKPRKRLKVEPEAGGQLEQLLVVNKRAHDDMEQAKEQEAEYKLAIKTWLLSLFPDPADLPDSFDIAGDPHGRFPAYTMTLKGGKRLDSRLLRENIPDLYERYEVDITPSWELRESSGGRRR
jgi:hypothetical protein